MINTSKIKQNKFAYLKISILLFSLAILSYNYAADKLYMEIYVKSMNVVLFIFAYSAILLFWRNNDVRCDEQKMIQYYFVFSLPALFMSNFLSIDSYMRYIALITFSPLGFYAGIEFGRIWAISKKKDIIITLMLVPSLSVSYLILQKGVAAVIEDSSRDYVFGFLIFVPLLLYYKNKFLSVIFLVLYLYITIVSLKRTGVLCVSIVGLGFALLSFQMNDGRFFRRVFTLILALLSLGVLYKHMPFISDQIDRIIYRFENFQDNSNDVRDLMYKQTLRHFENSSLYNQLFGHGCLGTSRIFDHPTHNDFLEILYDYGAIPLLFFVLFVCKYFKRCFITLLNSPTNSILLFVIISNFLIMSFGSCMITTPYTVFSNMLVLGFSIGCFANEINQSQYVN